MNNISQNQSRAENRRRTTSFKSQQNKYIWILLTCRWKAQLHDKNMERTIVQSFLLQIIFRIETTTAAAATATMLNSNYFISFRFIWVVVLVWRQQKISTNVKTSKKKQNLFSTDTDWMVALFLAFNMKLSAW